MDKELDDLVHKHDNGIKAQYDNLKTDYQRIKILVLHMNIGKKQMLKCTSLIKTHIRRSKRLR